MIISRLLISQHLIWRTTTKMFIGYFSDNMNQAKFPGGCKAREPAFHKKKGPQWNNHKWIKALILQTRFKKARPRNQHQLELAKPSIIGRLVLRRFGIKNFK